MQAHAAQQQRYERLRHLSTGGMAEVWLARTTGIGGFERLVVLKQILGKLATQEEFVQMFLDEARIAASLHHGNIVQVYDVGLDESVGYFYAMEFLHGHDVRALLRRARETGFRGGLPLEHALTVALGVCSGLHYAHEKVGSDGVPLGLVHRDVSPHNLFITFDGGVKVIDFGIAKARGRLTQGTAYGTLKGKFGYMSPEQCRGDQLDRRSDVFAIAVVLFEMTTGERLYTGTSDYEILKKIVEQDAPKPSKFDRRFPPELERIVLRGLDRDPRRRYASALEMQLDLDRFARELGVLSSPTALARYMANLYRDEIEAWQGAQRQGVSLAAHLQSREKIGDDDEPEAQEPADPMGDTRLPAPVPPPPDDQKSLSRSRPGPPPDRRTETMLPASTPPPVEARRSWLRWALGAFLFGASAAAGAWWWWNGRTEAHPVVDQSAPVDKPRSIAPPADPVLDLSAEERKKKKPPK